MSLTYYDKAHNEFQVEWRKRYIAALEAKYKFLKQQVERADNERGQIGASIQKDYGLSVDVKHVYAYHSYTIEALELEHKIYFEKIALSDWIARSTQVNDADLKKQQEAADKMSEVLEIVKQHAPQHERLRNLLTRYEASNKNDPEQREIIYSSFKVALQQLKIIE